jgi:hypothetical protein
LTESWQKDSLRVIPLLHTQRTSQDKRRQLNSRGLERDKPCHVTIDSEAFVIIAKRDITTGLPERKLSRPYILHMASGETHRVLNKGAGEADSGTERAMNVDVHRKESQPNSSWD